MWGRIVTHFIYLLFDDTKDVCTEFFAYSTSKHFSRCITDFRLELSLGGQ